MLAFRASHRPVRLFQSYKRANRTRDRTFIGRMFMDMVAGRAQSLRIVPPIGLKSWSGDREGHDEWAVGFPLALARFLGTVASFGADNAPAARV
jgi:hypothetical protein